MYNVQKQGCKAIRQGKQHNTHLVQLFLKIITLGGTLAHDTCSQGGAFELTTKKPSIMRLDHLLKEPYIQDAAHFRMLSGVAVFGHRTLLQSLDLLMVFHHVQVGSHHHYY